MNFDRWTVLKLFEVILTVACLIFKRITDDEASRLSLYLQKLSREWSLLNNVTWDRVGSAVADASYGGYVIITSALFIGRIMGELPTHKRITEFILLGVGALLFIILGSLEFASLDSVPENLVDNAAIIGTLTLVTAALFLLDMGGPKAQKVPATQQPSRPISKPKPVPKNNNHDVEKQAEDLASEQKQKEMIEKIVKQQQQIQQQKSSAGGGGMGTNGHGPVMMAQDLSGGRYRDGSMYKKIKDENDSGKIKTRPFGIYGKDIDDGSDTDGTGEIPPRMEEHSPVWSQYGKYDILSPSYVFAPPSPPKADKSSKHRPHLQKSGELLEADDRPPSTPGDPGYVQYTAQHWGEGGPKTPRHSPTQV